jgi:YbbR domain-containing protein
VSLIRGLLFDNLGLKLVALLLAVVVYLNVYTDRPASMVVSFPILVTDLPDSLTVVDVSPPAVAAELRGTGKQLIRLRVSEPPIKVSLAGVAEGHFERSLGPEDLPLPEGLRIQVDRMVSPRTLSMTLDRRVRRTVPVAPRVEGTPATGAAVGRAAARPDRAELVGPRGRIGSIDSLVLDPVAIGGQRDTVRATVGARVPEGAAVSPMTFEVVVPVHPARR